MFFKNLKIAQKLFLGFGIVTLLMLTVLGYTYVNFTKESQAVAANLRTYSIIRESDGILISLINMETGARGYAITGKDEFLEPYNQGKIDYQKHYDRIKQLTLDKFNQQDRLNELEKGYEQWLSIENDITIVARQKVFSGQIKMEDLISNIQLSKGKNQMDKLRKTLSDIVAEEQSLLAAREANLVKMESMTRIIMILGGILATILSMVIAALVIRMVVSPVSIVTNTFKEISEGDADLEVRLNASSKDELGDMAKYFNRFMCKLRELITENKNQSWLKSGQAELNEKIRGEQDLVVLCTSIISYIVKYIYAQIGAVYIKTDKGTFKLFGSYSHNKRKNLSNEIKLGEGVIGQAALEKQTIIITSVPEDYIKISSGLGEAVPRNIMIVPCLYSNEVKAIIELGSFNEFTDIQLKFVEQLSDDIATAINLAEGQNKMSNLLNKTLQQAEELQAQQEELRQSNEELEEQTKALRESELSLQAQQQELRVVNEELEERTKLLEKQKNDIIMKNNRLEVMQVEIEEKAKALESANRYKSEFLANMSHELRTPLNSILVLSQMLADKKDNQPLTDRQLEFAQTIHSSGEGLLRLINDILDLSKVEAGKMEVNLENLNLRQLAENTRRVFEPIAIQKGLNFKIQIEDNLPEDILSDGHRMQQIINNLLSNAFKFTHQGEVTMTIGYPKKSEVLNFKGDTENLIGISIKDSGIGIPADKQSLIFEAFRQSDGTTSRKYGGTGLGLSISKEFAHLLGGTILLKSKQGEGSTFTLIIPNKYNNSSKSKSEEHEKSKYSTTVIDDIKKEDNLPVKEKLLEAQLSDDREYIDKNDKIILVIEDEKNFLGILQELAHEKGYKCLLGENGETGIALARKYKPDAILLDIGLPDISGWKVIEKLKEEKVTSSIPVHVISGKENRDLHEVINGLVGYLKKPISLEELNNVFKTFEYNISKPFKKLLIVDEDKQQVERIVKMLNKKDIHITSSNTGMEAYNLLKKESFDCMVLDLELRDMSGLELLSKLREENIKKVPVIIHTEKELTQKDEAELQEYSDSIIIKGTRSIDRLVDEASLFIHDIDSKIEESKIKAIQLSHEKNDLLNGKKILVVDDDMRNVFALSGVLEEKGVKVVVGRNGKEGISKLEENSDIDLILMDIMMPEMDGYTAMREIRKKEKSHKIPIIAITAKAMKEDRKKCIEAGANDYLTKPVDIDKLISLLRVWLYK